VVKIILYTLWVLHRGWACSNTSLRNFGGKPFGVKTDTGTPSNSSASVFNPASVSKLVECPGSTNRSRSLSSVSVPLTTDPKIRGLDRPWWLTSCRNSLRWTVRASEGFIRQMLRKEVDRSKISCRTNLIGKANGARSNAFNGPIACKPLSSRDRERLPKRRITRNVDAVALRMRRAKVWVGIWSCHGNDLVIRLSRTKCDDVVSHAIPPRALA